MGAGTEDPLWKKLVDGRQTGRRLRHQVRPLEAVPSRPSLGRFVEPRVGWQGDGRLRVKMFTRVRGAWGPPGRSLPWKTRGVSRQKDAAGLAPATTPPPSVAGGKGLREVRLSGRRRPRPGLLGRNPATRSLTRLLAHSLTHSFVHPFVSPPAVAPARTFLRPRGPHQPRHTLRRHWPLRLSEPVVAAAVVITTPVRDHMPAGKTSVAGRPALGDAR